MSQQAGASSSTTSYTKYASLPDVDTSAPDVYEYEGPSRTDDASHSRRHRSRKHRTQGGADAADTDSSSDDSDHSAGHRKHAGDAKGAANNEDIDSSSLKRSDAASKFTSATDLDTDAVDFSGRLPHRRSRKNRAARPIDAGVETATYALDDSQSAGDRAQESLVDRLRRLRFEASQLEEELKGEGDGAADAGSANGLSEVDSTQMLAQLKLLHDQLARLPAPSNEVHAAASSRHSDQQAFRALLDQIKQAPSAAPANDAGATPAAGAAPSKTTGEARSADVVQLEARLSELESTLGVHEALLDESKPVPRPVLSTLSRLEHQLSLLSQPRHLDAISRRVKVLVTEMDRVNETRRKLTSDTAADGAGGEGASKSAATLTPAELTKLQQVFDVSTRLEPLLPIVPSVLERLQTLADLHASAAHFGSVLDTLEHGRDARQAQQDELNELLHKMEANMQQNTQTVEANLAALQQRIEDVSSRLRRLQ